MRNSLGGTVPTMFAALLGTPGAASAADAFPSKPIHLVVGCAPVGGTDILARLVGQRLANEFGRPEVI